MVWKFCLRGEFLKLELDNYISREMVRPTIYFPQCLNIFKLGFELIGYYEIVQNGANLILDIHRMYKVVFCVEKCCFKLLAQFLLQMINNIISSIIDSPCSKF